MPYSELHCHSYFSLLDGASAPAELAQRAAELGLPALALTDHDAVYGAVEFVQACRGVGIRPILGAELTLSDDSHLTLLVQDSRGWTNLCRLITLARHNADKGRARLPADALADHADGLIALSGCRRGAVAAALLRRDRRSALAAARRLRDLFTPDRFWIELHNHLRPHDKMLNHRLHALAQYLGVGVVAGNNVHYARPAQHPLQDVLVCIRHLTTLDQSERLRRPNSEYYLKSGREMAALFGRYPDALTNTERIAARCTFELTFGLQDLPAFPVPDGLTAPAFLRRLCLDAVPRRYPAALADVTRQLHHELHVIERAGLANYFLIVWDIVRFARSAGIRCQGRGSAANSLVAYLLGISPVDPLRHDLVFERFLSAERQAVPDIDIDFDAARREEVIQYVYRRYGADHTAMACTFSTFRTRSAVRDVARALGLSAEQAARALDILHEQEWADRNPIVGNSAEPVPDDDPLALLIDLSRQLYGLPRHLGLHNGGMIVMGPPLATRLPSEPATMADRSVVQWDKDGLETAGLVKIDILGLRMLSAVDEAVRLIAAAGGPAVDLDQLTPDDPAVYAMITAADTMGVFQVESRAQAQVLPRLRPTCFNDLIVSISLIRPGPVQGNMVHPYLRRRDGDEPVTYLHPSLEPALRETLGVILFQEQVLKVARDFAGFTAGQGEQLRRALGHKHSAEAIERFHADFIAGARQRGIDAAVAEQVFGQLRAFGGYSFAKSHAAAFAVLVYQSAWLRRYHAPAFFTALLNNQPMGFWTPAVLVGDARRLGLRVLPVHLGRSDARCTVEGDDIRLGFNYVKGWGEAAVTRLLTARDALPFAGLRDLCYRTRLPRRLIENLIAAGGLDAWGVGRRRLLWQLGRLTYQVDELPLAFADDDVTLPVLDEAEAQALEIGVTGLSTGAHVMAHYREWLQREQVLGSRDVAACRTGQRVQVAGLLVVHQAPYTAKGFRFLTLEDEDGLLNVIVRPQVYPRYRPILHTTRLLLVTGVVERQGAVVNILATHIIPLRPRV